MEALNEFPFLQLRCKQSGPFSDAGNIITSKSCKVVYLNLFAKAEISALELKMKNKIFFLALIHSLADS
jgi:hypothetical protein